MPLRHRKSESGSPAAAGSRAAAAAAAPEIPRPSWHAGVVGVLIVGAAFSNAVEGAKWIQDDQTAIEKNADVTGTTTWAEVFTNDFWGTSMTSPVSNKSYRPIAIAWMRVVSGIFGKLPEVLKVGNIAWHAVCVVLVHEVCRRILFPKDAARCWWVMVLFAVHPVHSESVDGLVGIADLLSMAFALAAVLLSHYGRFLPAAAALGLSFFSKEVGLTVAVPILAALALNADAPLTSTQRKVGAGIITTAVVGYLGIRHAIAGGKQTVEGFRHMDNMLAFVEDTGSFYLTMANVWWKYLVMLLYPAHLAGDYSYNAIPAVEVTPENLAFYGVFVATSGALALGVLYSQQFVPCFCVVFFLASFFPASHLLYRPGVYIAERLMYTPSLAVCVFVVWAMSQGGKRRVAWHAFFGVVAVWFATLLWGRNEAWLTPMNMWGGAVAVNPNSGRAQLSYGLQCVAEGNPADLAAIGLGHLLRAKEITTDVDYCQPDYWIGRYHVEHTRNYTAAIDWMWKATKCKDLDHYKFAYDALEEIYKVLVLHQPKNSDWPLQLAQAYYQQGKYAEAEGALSKAVDSVAGDDEKAAAKMKRVVEYLLAVTIAADTDRLTQERRGFASNILAQYALGRKYRGADVSDEARNTLRTYLRYEVAVSADGKTAELRPF